MSQADVADILLSLQNCNVFSMAQNISPDKQTI